MADFNFNPLPDEEQSLLMEELNDILHNGAKLPQETSNTLIMAAVRETYRCVQQARNQSRKNSNAIKWLGAGFAIITIIMISQFGPDIEWLSFIFP